MRLPTSDGNSNQMVIDEILEINKDVLCCMSIPILFHMSNLHAHVNIRMWVQPHKKYGTE